MKRYIKELICFNSVLHILYISYYNKHLASLKTKLLRYKKS